MCCRLVVHGVDQAPGQGLFRRHAPAGVLAHLSAQYKFNQATGSANSAVEVSFGGEYAGLSVDAFYSKIKDAVAISALSAAQVAGLSGLCPNPLPAGGSCVAASATNALAATISRALARSPQQ